MFDEDSPVNTSVGSSRAISYQPWGIASLVIGCTLFLASCVMMVFNIILFGHGMRGIPVDLARTVGTIAFAGVALMGVFSVVFGIRGWLSALSHHESTAFGVAGTMVSLIGLFAWIVAGGDMLMVLGLFTPRD